MPRREDAEHLPRPPGQVVPGQPSPTHIGGVDDLDTPEHPNVHAAAIGSLCVDLSPPPGALRFPATARPAASAAPQPDVSPWCFPARMKHHAAHAAPALRLTWRILLAAAVLAALAAGLITTVVSAFG
ncbi:hypothetical protein GCM10018962_82910 [Dactylosporangium matsuzakiense]|uniref:Uncharacterized protein n=2 Tax=Dactylosporangium TaxID=35753 RepID=A0A9W6KBN2_9ACTN|nr:hypothetical protein GCM10017581_001080 [Dactylosporangium matsuzakiense]